MNNDLRTQRVTQGGGPRVAPGSSPGSAGCTRSEIPYTHAIHAKRCHEAGKQGKTLVGQHVQVKTYKTTCCARIVTAWDTSDGLEMWQLDLLEPIKGRISSPARFVRQCSGLDGLCSCAAETADRASAAPHASAESALEGVRCL